MGVIAPAANHIAFSGDSLGTLCTYVLRRLKLCCTAAPRLLILFSLDGNTCERLKLCCTGVPRLLISSLDGTSSVRLKLQGVHD